jgi:hypothetical protein
MMNHETDKWFIKFNVTKLNKLEILQIQHRRFRWDFFNLVLI